MKKDISVIYFIIQCALFVAMISFYVCALCGLGQIWKFCTCFEATKFCLSTLAISMLLYILYFCKIRATKALQIYFIVALMGHFIGGDLFNLYVLSRNYNYILHFINSCMIGVIVYGIILRNVKKQGPIFMLIMTISAVVTVGVIWEFYEYAADSIMGLNMQRFRNSKTYVPFIGQRALQDTMYDLFMDFIGGLFAGVFAYPVVINGKSLYQHFELCIVDIKSTRQLVTYHELPVKNKSHTKSSEELQNQIEIDNIIVSKLENQLEIEDLKVEENPVQEVDDQQKTEMENADENKMGEGGEN